MQTKTKWIRIFAVLVLVTMLLAACGQSSPSPAAADPTKAPAAPAADTADAEEASDEPAEPAHQELVEIEFMNMSQNWTPPVFGADPVTTIFMEKTGVKLICVAPQGDPDQIANVMLVSEDYPEMMHMGVETTFNKYASAGALLSLDKLAEEYGYPNIVNGEYIPESIVNIRRSADGELYVIPNWFSEDGFGTVGRTLNVRKDIYTDLGSPELKTIDQFYAYLQAIKDAELTTLDGLKVFPLAYKHENKNSIGYIANWWGSNIIRYSYFNEETRKVEFFLRNPDMLEAVKFLSKCLANGLLDPEVLTMDVTQRTEAYNTGKYGVVLSELWDLWTPNSALSQVDPDMYYFSMGPPQGNPNKQPFFGCTAGTGSTGTMITKNCKNPEAAIRFCDYFLSPEGNTLNFYGVEGLAMEFVDGKPQLYPEAYEAKLADWEGARIKYGIRAFDYMNHAKYNWERDQESEVRKADRKVATDFAFDGSIIQAIVIDPATEEGILYSEIDANITSELTKMVLEPDPAKIEAMMQELLTEYERRGIANLEALMTEFYVSKL